MYLTVTDMKKLHRALYMAFQPDVFDKLTTDQRQVVIEADMIIMRLYKKRMIYNRETNRKIREKRKESWSYGRSKKEIEKHNAAVAKRAAKLAQAEAEINNACYENQALCVNCNFYRTTKDHPNLGICDNMLSTKYDVTGDLDTCNLHTPKIQ